MNYHVVKTGDTPYKLSQIYNISVESIIRANPDINPNFLMVGQIICIPISPKEECPENASKYTIKEGDTLYSIAKMKDIPLNILIETNPNIDPNSLILGEVLCIPQYSSTYINKLYRISFNYPSKWREIMENYYKDSDGFFVVSTISSSLSLNEVCKKEAYQDFNPYGSNPTIKEIKINDEEGCLIIPSPDQVSEMDNQASLIVKYPKSIDIKGIEHNYVIIFAEKNYIQMIANSLKFI